MKKLLLSVLSLLSLNSCAVGSAFSAYSMRSIEADGLSRSAELDIIDKVKKEIYVEHTECSIIMHVTSAEESSQESK